jgi:Competence protein CoiA-like family
LSLLVPFGLKDGVLYEPRHVSNGKPCGCICPSCHHPLIARQNAQTPHFAHAAGEDCQRGFETAIHLAAKQLIAERMELAIPAVNLNFLGGWGEKSSIKSLYVSHLKKLSKVCIEPWLDDFRPDLVVTESVKNSEILIEIAVTHFVDEAKLAKIKSRGIQTIEIDVSIAREKMDFALLNHLLFDVPSRGKWLYHPQAARLEEEYLENLKKAWEAKSQDELNRFETYRRLSPKEKTRRNLAKTHLSFEALKALTIFVPGEGAYQGGRLVWQSAVLAYIVNQVDEQGIEGISYGSNFESDDVADWLAKLFYINRSFPDAEKIALWKYLKHLESLGLLKVRKTTFEILMLPKDFKC